MQTVWFVNCISKSIKRLCCFLQLDYIGKVFKAVDDKSRIESIEIENWRFPSLLILHGRFKLYSNLEYVCGYLRHVSVYLSNGLVEYGVYDQTDDKEIFQ